VKPAGHDPSFVDVKKAGSQLDTPEWMYHEIVVEHELKIYCVYTHYSRYEVIFGQERYERRFSRGAYHPLDVPPSMRALMVDDSDHVRLRIKDGSIA
jgi:hypothetical protein